MPDALTPIEDACRDAKIQTRRLTAGHGELLVSLNNGRILGCALDGGANLIYSPDGTTAGGDRLWIAPEVAYNWPSLEKAREDPAGNARVPEQMDPGQYELIDERSDSVRVQTTMELVDQRVGLRVALEAERWFEVIPQLSLPGELQRELETAGVRVVNFGITNRLRLINGDPDAVAGAWDILQLPRGGTLVCPTSERANPTSYYDAWDGQQVRVEDNAVYFHGDGRARIKMGLAPWVTTGVMGYYTPGGAGADSSLIVRLFVPEPEAEYVDQPITADASTRTGGDCLQAYADDDAPFAEMEHHSRGIIVAQTDGEIVDRSSTHCFVGPDAQIRQLGEHLLGVPMPPAK